MKFDELEKKYGLLIDKEGNYYRVNEQGEKEEPFATMSVIVQLLNISLPTILNRVKLTEINSINFINQHGRIYTGYSLNQVLRFCHDILEKLPLAQQSGIAIINGKKFASINALSKLLGLSSSIIKPRVDKLPSVIIKNAQGQIVAAFNLQQVKLSCSDHLQKLPRCNEGNSIQINGQEFATVNFLTKLLGISEDSIRVRIEHLDPIKLKNNRSKIIDAYNIQEVRSACTDLSADFATADKNGIAIINGEKYAPIYILGKLFNRSAPPIINRIKQLTTIKIKDLLGRILTAYNIEDAKKACADLLSDKTEIALIDGQQIASLKELSKILGISDHTINARVKLNNLSAFAVGFHRGRSIKAYSIEAVKLACADLLKVIPIADATGIVTIGNQKFATVTWLGKNFGIHPSIMRKRIAQKKLASVLAKNLNGRVHEYYEIILVQQLCSDFNNKIHPAKT